MTAPVVVTKTADLEPAPGLAGIRKAVSAAVAAGVAAASAALVIALPDGVTATEWVTIAGAFVAVGIAAGLTAYTTSNDLVPVMVVQAHPTDPPLDAH